MILECENCESKFRMDESLLKAGGSKVRCSVCKHVFIAYPPEALPSEDLAPDQILDEGLDATLSLEARAALHEEEAPTVKEADESEFDLAFEEALEEADVHEAVSPDEIPDIEEEEIGVTETADMTREGPEAGPMPAVAEVPRAKRDGSRVLPLVLLIILLVVGGGAAVFFLAPDLIPDSVPFLKSTERPETRDPGVARLSFKAVTGSFIESDSAGQLFVIKGMVTNNYSKPRNFILVKGTVLDDKGKAVKTKMAYAGNTFTEKEIKEKPLEELDKGLRDKFGKGKMNFNLQPGATIPFMIILDQLPENVTEFTVEAVSSLQAT